MSRRDFDAIAGYFAEDSHYTDVPAPEDGARGPAAIVARLRLGIEPLERYEPLPGNMVAEGDTVILEHSEAWYWGTGEHLVLPFVSVFELRRIDRTLVGLLGSGDAHERSSSVVARPHHAGLPVGEQSLTSRRSR